MLNNFKEIKITPNEDGTFKIEYYGVVCKDVNGQEFELKTVTYPKVKIKPLSFGKMLNKTQFEIEVFPDFSGELITACISEKE